MHKLSTEFNCAKRPACQTRVKSEHLSTIVFHDCEVSGLNCAKTYANNDNNNNGNDNNVNNNMINNNDDDNNNNCIDKKVVMIIMVIKITIQLMRKLCNKTCV